MRAPLALLLILAAVPAAAIELPVRGVFGAAPADCKAAKDEMEGDYIAFETDGSTGEGGAGGCRFASVKQLAPKRYELTGLCASLDGPKKRLKRILVIKSADEISYGEGDYRRCKGA